MPVQKRVSLLFALFVWGLLLLRFGYRYGTGDQVELLPYTLYLHQPQLYPHDFFIQGLNASIPNERTVMATLLLPFVNHLEFFCFLFQMFTTVFLVLGLERIALRFVRHKYLAWLAIITALIPLNDFGLGNVEVYSECLQASGVTCALVIWALNLFLDRKYLWVAVLLSIGTFIQVLDGLDIMMVLSAMLLWNYLQNQVSCKTVLSWFVLFGLTAGIFLVLILYQKSIGTFSTSHLLSPSETFKVMIEFRHPHHFIFATFSKGKIAVYAFLTVVALIYFFRQSKQLFRFVLLSTIGLLIYIIATDIFHLLFIADFQFYKVTQWVKFLGVVAALGFVSDYLWKKEDYQFPKVMEQTLLAFGGAASFVIIIFFHSHLPYTVPYQLFGMKQQEDILRICESIQTATPPDAVFIQPFENTELKFYAQRSSYVEFKANVRHKAYVAQWYDRIQEVFGVNDEMKLQGFKLQQRADEHFYHLSSEELQKLKQQGVGYILTQKEYPPALGKLILENNSYAVYQL